MTAPAHNAAATITPRNAKDRPESKERAFAGVRSRFAGDFTARLCLAKADSLRLKIPTGIDRVAINQCRAPSILDARGSNHEAEISTSRRRGTHHAV
jgi:hypothetical protein